MDMIEEYRAMVDRAPVESVLECARNEPSLRRGGFKVVPQNAGEFRRRIRAAIREPWNPPDWLRMFLFEADLQMPLLSVLSEKAIRYALPELAVVYGRGRLAANLALDGREEVRLLADEEWGETEAETPEEAVSRLVEKFIPFLGALDELGEVRSEDEEIVEDEGAVEDEGVGEWRERYEREREKTEAEAERWRRAKERLNEKLASQERDIEALKARADRQREEIGQARAEAHRLGEELERARAAEDERVGERVRAELDSIRALWLRGPMQVENAARAAAAASDLPERVRRVLDIQAQHDRHYGNVRTLEQRLAVLRDCAGQIEQARATALDPLPETRDLLRDVRSEIARIETKLEAAGRSSRQDRRLVAFEMAINTAANLNAIEDARRLVEDANRLSAIVPEDFQHLNALCMERATFFTDRDGPRPQVLSKTADGSLGLIAALAGNEPCFVLVDGYNVILGLPRFAPLLDGGYPGQAAREALAQAWVRLTASAPNGYVSIFFDGPERSERQCGATVRVVFSGGEGEHRADRSLLDYLTFCRREHSAISCYVITDDAEIAAAAREARAHHLSLDRVSAFLVPS